MRLFQFKSISSRLIFWFCVVALIPLVIALSVTYTQRVAVIEARTLDKLVAIRDLKVERLSDWLKERIGDLNVIARDEGLSVLEGVVNENRPFLNNSIEVLAVRNHLSNFLHYYSSYAEISIINPLTEESLYLLKKK